MSKIVIPSDIKRCSIKKAVSRVVLWLAETASVVVFLCFFGERAFGGFGVHTQRFIYVVLPIVPIFLTKLYKLVDFTWRGEILEIDVSSETASERNFKPTINSLYTKETVRARVKLNSGKIIRRKIFEGRAEQNNISESYHVGDEVVHVYGTDFLQILNDSKSDRLICVVCGAKVLKDEEFCDLCGHTLKII